MIHGDSPEDLAELRARAKRSAMLHYVRIADGDGTPPALRAMYVRKAEQAQLVLNGGTSELIAGEAEVRGIAPEVMAQIIVSMASHAGDQLEIARMATNVAIEAAVDEVEIANVLGGRGIQLLEHVA